MLNNNIRIDLHIHSKASKYKESGDIVDKSTFENIDVLLNKLVSKGIRLFSFTDHNRFDADLYNKTIVHIEKSNASDDRPYKNLISIIPGIEFDVSFEKGHAPCHVITIFKADSPEQRQRISDSIQPQLLMKQDDYYSLKQYEEILKKINLSVIVIVCQRKDLCNNSKSGSDLSGSTSRPFEVLKYGYINALEYKSVKNEGILKKNLVDNELPQGLLCGSDCHEWESYPYHDKTMKKNVKNEDDIQFFTEIKALPTFKGLLMALTSTKTRFKRMTTTNNRYIKGFSCNGVYYNLTPGINAIIGENGSGKSTLLKCISGSNIDGKAIKYFIKKNIIIADENPYKDKMEYIPQSELVNKYAEGGHLFSNDFNFSSEVDNTKYQLAYKKYINYLKNTIQSNINIKKQKEKIHDLAILQIDLNCEKEKSHFVDISCKNNFADSSNIHSERVANLNTVISYLNNEIENSYYTAKQRSKLEKSLEILATVYNEVKKENDKFVNVQAVKNYIKNKIDEYNEFISDRKTTKEEKKTVYNKQKQEIVDSIVGYVRLVNEQIDKAEYTSNMPGVSSVKKNGFIFQTVAKYDETNLKEEFYRIMFVDKYKSEDDILKIDSETELTKALRGITAGNAFEYLQKLSKKTLENFFETKNYIIEESSSKKIGSTLGEMSLMFYKYITNNNNEIDIFILDQPEDNISNARINDFLVKFFNKMRSEKQIIMATHNPLLVVNLDADNVICLNNENENQLDIKAGCLEDEENEILSLVAKYMDGGRKAIERRMKFYGEID